MSDTALCEPSAKNGMPKPSSNYHRTCVNFPVFLGIPEDGSYAVSAIFLATAPKMPHVRVCCDARGEHLPFLRRRPDEGIDGRIDIRPAAEPKPSAQGPERIADAVRHPGSRRGCHGGRRPGVCADGQRARPTAGVIFNCRGGRRGTGRAMESRNDGAAAGSTEEASRGRSRHSKACTGHGETSAGTPETGSAETRTKAPCRQVRCSKAAGAAPGQTASGGAIEATPGGRIERSAIRLEGHPRRTVPALRFPRATRGRAARLLAR